MKTSTKVILVAVIVLALIVAYVYPRNVVLVGASPTGSIFTTAKFASIVVNLANTGANGTSTSILNTDTNDRYVSGFKIGCENVGTSQTAGTGASLAQWKVAVGTTSSASPVAFNGYAPLTNGYVLSTTTVNLVVASTTTAVATSSMAAIWQTNTNMTFFYNATNTAVCTEGVEYFGS